MGLWVHLLPSNKGLFTSYHIIIGVIRGLCFALAMVQTWLSSFKETNRYMLHDVTCRSFWGLPLYSGWLNPPNSGNDSHDWNVHLDKISGTRCKSISWTRMFTMEPRPFVPSMAVSAPCQTIHYAQIYVKNLTEGQVGWLSKGLDHDYPSVKWNKPANCCDKFCWKLRLCQTRCRRLLLGWLWGPYLERVIWWP